MHGFRKNIYRWVCAAWLMGAVGASAVWRVDFSQVSEPVGPLAFDGLHDTVREIAGWPDPEADVWRGEDPTYIGPYRIEEGRLVLEAEDARWGARTKTVFHKAWPANTPDWTVEARLDEYVSDFLGQGAGILVGTPERYIRFVWGRLLEPGAHLYGRSGPDARDRELAGVKRANRATEEELRGPVWLRLMKRGDRMWGFYSFDGEEYLLAGFAEGYGDFTPEAVGLSMIDPNPYRRQTRVRRGDAQSAVAAFDYVKVMEETFPELIRANAPPRVFVRFRLNAVEPADAAPIATRVTFHRNTYFFDHRFNFDQDGRVSIMEDRQFHPGFDNALQVGQATPWMDWSEFFTTPRTQITPTLSLITESREPNRHDNGNVDAYDVTIEFASAPDEDAIVRTIHERADYHTLTLFMSRLDQRRLGDWRIRTLKEYANDRLEAFLAGGAKSFDPAERWLSMMRGTFEGTSIMYYPEIEAIENEIRALLGKNIPYLHPTIYHAEFLDISQIGDPERRETWAPYASIWGPDDQLELEAMAEILKPQIGTYKWDWGEYLPEEGPFVYQVMDEPMLTQTHQLRDHEQGMGLFREYVQTRVDQPQDVGVESWDQVQPVNVEDVRTLGDARRYVLTRWFKQQWNAKAMANITKAVNKAFDGRAITTSCSVGPFTRALDPFVEARYEAHHMLANHFNGDIWRAAAYSSAGRMADNDTIVAALWWPGHFRSDVEAINGIIAGFEGIYAYVYGPRYIGWSYWVDDESADTIEHFVRVSNAARLAAQYEHYLFDATPAPREVAFILSRSAKLWMGQAGGEREYNVVGDLALGDVEAADAAEGQELEEELIHFALHMDGYPSDIVPEEEVEKGRLANYKVAYLTARNLSTTAQDNLADWVRAGGTLFLGPEAATADELDQPLSLLYTLGGGAAFPVDAEPAGRFFGYGQFGEVWRALDTYLPYHTPELQKLGEVTAGERLAGSPVTFDAVGRRQRLRLPEARFLAQFEDGEPAMVEWAVGQGRVIKAGTMLGAAYARRAEPAFQPGRTIFFRGMCPQLNRIILYPCRAAGLAQPISADNREINTGLFEYEDGQGALALFGNHRPGIQEAVPVEVRLQRVYEQVQTFTGQPVEVEWDGTTAMFTMDLESIEAVEFLP